MSRCDEPGWALCSMHDPSGGRRGIWFRVTRDERRRVVAVEVCAGRDGDDWYTRIDTAPSAASVYELFEALDVGRWMVEDHGTVSEAVAEAVAKEREAILRELRALRAAIASEGLMVETGEEFTRGRRDAVTHAEWIVREREGR